MKLKKIYNELLNEDLKYAFSDTDGPEDDEYEIGPLSEDSSGAFDLLETLIDEEYPSSFNMEDFKKLTSFNQRIKYCQENLTRISSGSGRIVYKIDNEKVLKLAKNKKGLAQNEVEISQSHYRDIEDITARVFDYHQDDLWSEMELARKLTVKEFQRITGFKWKDFIVAVEYEGRRTSTFDEGKLPISKEMVEAMWENEFTYSIFSYMPNYEMKWGDLTKLSSYGIVKRFGENTVVLIDYGFNSNVYDGYYA